MNRVKIRKNALKVRRKANALINANWGSGLYKYADWDELLKRESMKLNPGREAEYWCHCFKNRAK